MEDPPAPLLQELYGKPSFFTYCYRSCEEGLYPTLTAKGAAWRDLLLHPLLHEAFLLHPMLQELCEGLPPASTVNGDVWKTLLIYPLLKELRGQPSSYTHCYRICVEGSPSTPTATTPSSTGPVWKALLLHLPLQDLYRMPYSYSHCYRPCVEALFLHSLLHDLCGRPSCYSFCYRIYVEYSPPTPPVKGPVLKALFLHPLIQELCGIPYSYSQYYRTSAESSPSTPTATGIVRNSTPTSSGGVWKAFLPIVPQAVPLPLHHFVVQEDVSHLFTYFMIL